MNQNNETKTINIVNPNTPVKQEPANPILKSQPGSDSPFVIAIDHGYGNIKTPTFIFPACVTPCDQEMSFAMNDVLTYEDKRYAIGTGHKEFRQDKIMDDDYYILTLAAIGKELRHRGLTTAKIVIAAGLPLTWADKQREQFKAYLSKNTHVDFTYQDSDYHVDIVDVLVFYQGLAAVANRLGQVRGTNMLADIGNGTMNVMNINERQPVPASCFTEKYGTYQCVIAVREMLQREFSTLPTDAQIERYLRSLQADMGERYQKVIGTTAKEYVAEIFRRLREHNYDPALMRLWVTGGGSCLVRNFGEYNPNRVTILSDIHANARGYEAMAKLALERRQKKVEQKQG